MCCIVQICSEYSYLFYNITTACLIDRLYRDNAAKSSPERDTCVRQYCFELYSASKVRVRGVSDVLLDVPND